MASIFDKIRETVQKAASNFQGNVQAISNPQTRSTWVRGFASPVTNVIQKPVQNLKTNFSILTNPKVPQQTRTNFAVGMQQPDYGNKKVQTALQPLRQLASNYAITGTGGVRDYREGFSKLQSPGLFNKVSGAAQMVRGTGKLANFGNPLFLASSVGTMYPQLGKNDRIRRASAGLLQGMSGESTLGYNVPSKNINILGEKVDPLKLAGTMYGFTQNPVNKKFFQLTTKMFPMVAPFTKKWLALTLGRGGVEGTMLALPDIQPNWTDKQKSDYMVKNLLTGAGMELGGQTISEGSKMALNKSGFTKFLAKQYDTLANMKREWTIPVKRSSGEVVPIWKEKLNYMLNKTQDLPMGFSVKSIKAEESPKYKADVEAALKSGNISQGEADLLLNKPVQGGVGGISGKTISELENKPILEGKKAQQILGQTQQTSQQVGSVPPQIPSSGGKGSSRNIITNPNDPFYNINKLNVTDDAKIKIKDKITGEFKPTFEKALGKTMTADEIALQAKSTSDDLIKTIGRQKTADLGAAQLRLRQSIAQMINDGKVNEDLLVKLKADKTFAANSARLLQQRGISAEPNSPNGRLLQRMLGNILDIEENIDVILKKAKGVDFTNPDKSAQFYRQFIKPTAGEWIDKLRYNSMLTSPKTHIINITSNWQGTGVITPIQKTIEGAIDSVVSNLTGRPRTRYAGEGLAYAKGYYNKNTVKQAYKRMLDVMSGRQFGEHPDLYNVPLATGGRAKIIESALDIGGRALESMDQFFKTLTSTGLEESYKYRVSKGAGVDQLSEKAAQEAQELLFRGDFTKKGAGVISNLLGSLGESVKRLTYSDNAAQRWIAKMTFPFVKIGTNLAKAGFEFNPVSGSINMIGNADKTAQMAKILIGSGITALAVPFALDDRITFDLPPATSNRGKLAREARIPAYSIKIGDKWISYTKMHPAIAWQLATVAALTNAWKDKILTEGGASAIAQGVFSAMKFGLDQTYYKNVSDFMNGMNGDFERFSSIPSNYLSQFIPFRAFSSWLNKIIDQYQRRPDTKADFVTQSLQQVMSQLPGLSYLVPQKLDRMGQPMKKQNQLINMFSPYQTTTEVQPYGGQYRELTDVTREVAPIKAESAKMKENLNNIWYEVQALPPVQQRDKLKQYLQDGTITMEQFKSTIWPKIKEQITAKATGGLSPAEEAVKNLSVQDEAKYYMGKVKDMTVSQKKAYFKDLYLRKVITKDTLLEIVKLDSK